MVVGIQLLISNPSGDLGEDTGKMKAQVVRIDPRNSGGSKACIPNAEVSA